MDRYINAGGLYVAEQIAFDRELSEEELAAVENRLKAKWFAAAVPQSFCPVGDISIGTGAALDFGNEAVTVSSVAAAGTGTLTAKAVRLGPATELELKIGSVLTVDSALSFADAFCLNVTVTADDPKQVKAGEYVLLTATGGITGFDPGSVTIASNLPATYSLSLRQKGDDLVLKIVPPGMAIIVR